MQGLRVFSGGAVIVLGAPLFEPIEIPTVFDQSPIERSLGLPQLLQVVVSYQGILKPGMEVAADELTQE